MDSKQGKQQTNGCETDTVSPSNRVTITPLSVPNHNQLTRIERQAMKSATGGGEGGSRNPRQHHHPVSNARPRRHSPAMVPASPPVATGGTVVGMTTITPTAPIAASGLPFSTVSLERRITRHSPPSSANNDRERPAATKSQKGSHSPGFAGSNQSPTKRGAQNSATLIPGAVASHQHNLQTQQLAASSGSVLSQAPVLAKRSQPTPASIVSSLAEITPLSNAKSSLSAANSSRHHYHGSQSSHHHHYHNRDHGAHTASAPSSNAPSTAPQPAPPSSASMTPSAVAASSVNTSLPTTNKRKRVTRPKVEPVSPPPLSPSSDEFVRASKRVRLQHQPFQSPSPSPIIPAILRHTSTPQFNKTADEKILVFQRGDFLAVRNENGGFFVCRTAQNVYKSSKRFKIQWMNNDKRPELYTPDFYDHTDFECILTNLRMKRADKSKYLLPKDEQQRTENILQRALNVENGMDVPDPLAVSKDGVDVSFVGKEEEEEVVQQQKRQKQQETPSRIKHTPRSTSRSSSRVTTGSSGSSSSVKTSSASNSRGRGRPRKASERVAKAQAKGNNERNKKAKIPSAVMKVRARARAMARAKMKGPASKTAALPLKAKGAGVNKRNQITANHVSIRVKATQQLVKSKALKKKASPISKKTIIKVERLQPNPKVIVFEKDPTFETNLPIPFISTSAHSRLLIRAVLLSDHTLLQALLADTKNVCSLRVSRSIHVTNDAYTYAVLREDHQLIRALLKAKRRNYAEAPDILLSEDDTGRPNSAMFGHHMRNVNVSRGGREGNNALLKDQYQYGESYPSTDDQTVIQVAVKNGISYDTLDVLSEGDVAGSTRNLIYRVIVDAIRNGHRKLAGQLVKEAFEKGGFGFNALHQEVLLLEDQPLSKFRPQSVIKKSIDNGRITPLHCAAINPNPKYLAALLSATVHHNILDKNGWQPIHYGAVCEGPGPLKLLLSRGVMLTETDTEGNTPLHLACRAGRLANVDLILKSHLSCGIKTEDDEKTKLRELPNKHSYTPLHLAAEQGHTEVVQKLLQCQADPEKMLSATQDKMTALMLAAQQGHFSVVNTLVQNGAKVEAKDKKQRTALTHAIMDGHAHVASYLLRLGADPNATDSSGNTLVHYAAAYGWYFCLKLLAEAGAALHLANDWKITPLSVAFVKGHVGLVDFLLSQPGADINVSVDVEDGKTLLMQTVHARLTPSMMERVRLLVEKFQCDCAKTDAKGNNALHHFVQSEVKHREYLSTEELWDSEEERLASLDDPEWALRHEEEVRFLAENQNEHDTIAEKVAGLLLRNGCGAQVANSEGESPFTLAVKQGSLVLVKEFMKAGCVLSPGHVETADETILHSLVRQASKKDVMALYEAILHSPNETCPRQVLLMMAQSYNRDGFTPLLQALKLLSSCKQVESHVCLIQLIKSLLKDLESDISKVVKKPQDDCSSALHLAAMCEEKTAVQLLLAEKPTTLDSLDSCGRTPLLVAIKHGNSSVAEALILAGAALNVRSPADSNLSALLLAAKNPKLLGVVELLAKSKSLRGIGEVNPVDGNNALHYVVVHQRTEVVNTVRALVETGGIDINCVNTERRSALHLAVNANAAGTDAFFGVEEFLLSKGAKTDCVDNRGRVPLHYAFINFERPDDTNHHDPIELVTILVSHMTSVDMADHFGQTPLHCASNRGATICGLHLCPKMKNVDPRDSNGNTPLGLSVLNGHEGCSLMLLQSGANCMADVIAPNKGPTRMWHWLYLDKRKPAVRPHTILKEAINRDWQGILFLMLDQLEANGKGLNFAIQASLQCQKYQLALKLISRVKHGWTLYSDKHSMLHTLAMEARPGKHEDLQLKVAQALLDKGVPPMARDEHGCSVLTYAAINWNHVLCHFFTDLMGTTVVVKSDPDKSHRTPFSALFWNLGTEDFPKAIKAWCLSLLEAGASPNVLTSYPIQESPFPGVSCLLTHNLYEEPGTTPGFAATRLSPLMRSVYAGNLDVARFLLSHGAHVDYCDDLQRTPLMHAARINNLKMIKLLLNPNYNPQEENRAYSDVNLRKTSDADLSRQDMQGWTVVHHAIAPLPTYSYVATSLLLHLLARLGAPLDSADTSGFTPKKLAAGRGTQNFVETLETLLKVSPENKLKVPVESFTVVTEEVPSAPVPPSGASEPANASTDDKKEVVKADFDYKKDCSLALKAIKTEEQVERNIPDPKSGFAGVGEVVMDPVQNVPYDVLLTMVDMNYGNMGIYNYYKMQVIRHPARDLIILFTNWGRVGDNGQHQKTPFSTLEEAVKEFCKIFRSKSGNSWDNIKQFTPQPKKYRLVSLEKRKRLPLSDVKVNLLRKVPSKLPKSLEHLLWTLLNYKQLRSSLTEYSVPEKAFQQLSQDNLFKAEKILKDIEKLIQQQTKVPTNDAYYGQLTNQLLELSEEFYQMVPIEGYQYEKLMPITSMSDVQAKKNVIHNLLHLEVAGQLLVAASSKAEEINPADYVYRCLRCNLELLKPESPEAQLILQYIYNTASQTNVSVAGIFRLSREGESQRLEGSGLSNNFLLWHGTLGPNLLGILATGLRVAPYDAVCTSGGLFGKGIYFADMFEKSRHYSTSYCYSSGTSKKKPNFMLVCQVALGRTKEVTLDSPLNPEGCDSFKAVGRREPDPTCSITWRGVTVPLGPPVEISEPTTGDSRSLYRYLANNEYIIQRGEQVALRYLVQFD